MKRSKLYLAISMVILTLFSHVACEPKGQVQQGTWWGNGTLTFEDTFELVYNDTGLNNFSRSIHGLIRFQYTTGYAIEGNSLVQYDDQGFSIIIRDLDEPPASNLNDIIVKGQLGKPCSERFGDRIYAEVSFEHVLVFFIDQDSTYYSICVQDHNPKNFSVSIMTKIGNTKAQEMIRTVMLPTLDLEFDYEDFGVPPSDPPVTPPTQSSPDRAPQGPKSGDKS